MSQNDVGGDGTLRAGGANGSGAAGRSISISVPPITPRPRKRTPSSYGGASLTSSIANLANTIIGTGMVALPGNFVHTGWALGLLLIAFCGFTGASGLYLLTRCANKLGGRRQSFFSVAMTTIPKGARWFDLAIALKCFGVSISYLIISGQLMPQVVLSFLKAAGHTPTSIPQLLLDRNFWVTFLILLLLPLCFLRKLDSLRHTSYLSLAAVVYLVIIVVFFFLDPTLRNSLPPRGEVHAFVLSPHLLAVFPVFVFAFTCAQNMLPVYNELSADDPLMHMDRAQYAIGASIGGAGCVYTVVSVLGYLEFGSALGDNIIAMYPSSSIFVAVGRLAIVLLTIFSYPLQVHPCRAAIDKVIYPPQVGAALTTEDDDEGEDDTSQEAVEERTAYSDEDDQRDGARYGDVDHQVSLLSGSSYPSHSSSSTSDEIPLKRWVIITSLILTTTFTIALLVDDLSLILGFVGSLGSTTISFILPGVLYSSLHDRYDKLRRPAQALAIWGVFVGTVALGANVLKLFRTGVAVGPAAKADRLNTLLERW